MRFAIVSLPGLSLNTNAPRITVKKEPAIGRGSNSRVIFLLLGVAVYLYLNLFSLPDTPFLLGDDQVYFWMDAERMLDGGRIYQDFFQFTPPGTDLIYLALFKQFGLSLWTTNCVVLVLGIASCWLCFVLASEVVERRSAVLTTALFLVLIYGKLLDGTHHLFSAFAIMGAVKIYTRNATFARIVISGTLLGVASFFTQTHGAVAYLAFAVFFFWRRSREHQPWLHLLQKMWWLSLGYTVTLLLLAAPFIATIGWKQLWYYQIIYVGKHVIPMRPGMMGLPGISSWRDLPRFGQAVLVYLFLPVVYLLTLWRCWRERRPAAFPWEQITLMSLVGFFLMVEVAFNLNFLRLYSISLAGIVLLVWHLEQTRMMRPYAVAVMWIAISALAVWQTISAHKLQPRKIHLPSGEVATGEQAYEKLHWMTEHTRPGQFLFQAAWPAMYLPLQLRNPMFVDQIYPADGTPTDEVALTIQQLEVKQVPYVLWAARLGSMDNLSVRPKDHVVPLRAYLHSQYSEEHTFPDGDQVWHRNGFKTVP
ncbi:hypothetical protein RBB77_12570 [Tunturibacter psychrotolerans]|uniref:Glycosyltransferase RgtA/B/C/D-like domain-containing protein n=1 Tax=Tunturiibacter psychrotolerans TaxID=3069686 RepID=A0AAU7ZJA2_9BACT